MLGKTSLVAAVRARVPELTAAQAAAIVDALFRAIADLLARGEEVTIPGLGTLRVTQTGIAFRGSRDLEDVIAFKAERAFTTSEVVSQGRVRSSITVSQRVSANVATEISVVGIDTSRTGRRRTEKGDRSGELTPGFSLETAAESQPTYAVVDVFFATDRKATGATAPAEIFGGVRGDGKLAYGRCRVSIPGRHRIGRLEKPSLWRFELRQDPEKHVVLLAVERQEHDRFFADLAARVRAGERREMLLFVHGFNVTFEDAARRTAQIAYDLDFDGAAAFYSWPSKGVATPLAYTRDENSVEWTKPHLVGFLRELARDSGAERIHLIAHSMGNRALTAALQQIALAMSAGATTPGAPRFHEVILAAPDVDAEVFRDLAGEMMPAARHMTLYASNKDEALKLSYDVHGYPRAGDVAPEIVVVPGLDSVDASAVDTSFLGHSYVSDERSVISDILLMLRNGLGPHDRGLRSQVCTAGRYWIFPP